MQALITRAGSRAAFRGTSSFLGARKLASSSVSALPKWARPSSALLNARRPFHTTSRLASGGGGLNIHLDSEWNNPETPFDFLPEMIPEIEAILAKYPSNRKQSGILPLLHLAQRQNGGWIPLSAMNKIAEILECKYITVYECATFYSMFNREPVGKYHIQVCTTTPCMIVGSDEILEALERHLGINCNETTSDGLFTLGTMECLGSCVNAPMFVLSDYSNPPDFSYDYYEDLTVEKAIEIVESLRKGVKPPHGPQNGRNNAMGIQGKTTLFEEPPGPYCREIPK